MADALDAFLDSDSPWTSTPASPRPQSSTRSVDDFLDSDVAWADFTKPASRTWGEVGKDLGVSYAAGSGALLEMVGSLYGLASGDMDNWARNHGARTREFWTERKSEQLRAMEADRAAKIESQPSTLGKAGVAFWETIKSPSLLSSFVAEQAPNLLVTGAAGRGAGMAARATGAGERAAASTAVAGAVGAGASMQGADVGGSAYDQLMAIPDEVWMLNPDVAEATGGDASRLSDVKPRMAMSLSRDSAAASAMISLGLNMLPGARILEKSLAGVKLPGASSRWASAAKGFAGESISEAGEEGSGQFLSNVAASRVDPLVDTMEGVGEATGLGASAGIFGGAAGALSPRSRGPDDDKEAVNRIFEAGDVDEAIDAASAGLGSGLRTVTPGESRPVSAVETVPFRTGTPTGPRMNAEGQFEVAGIDRPAPQPGAEGYTNDQVDVVPFTLARAGAVTPPSEPAGSQIPAVDLPTRRFSTGETQNPAMAEAMKRALEQQTIRGLEALPDQTPDAAFDAAQQEADRQKEADYQRALAQKTEQDIAAASIEPPPLTPLSAVILRHNGEPFKSEMGAKLSAQMKDNPGATVVEVEGGFGLLPSAAPADVSRETSVGTTAASATPQARSIPAASNEAPKINPGQVIDAADQFEARQRAELQRQAQTAYAQEDAAAKIDSAPVDKEGYASFAPDSGTLNIPRAEMPQIKAEHRGALTQYLKGQGLSHTMETVPASSLKPTQAEFSPAKVRQAREYTEGDRSILISSDNYIIDGHHQALAKGGEDISVIRISAPIRQVLDVVKGFPSAGASAESSQANRRQPAEMTSNAPVAAGSVGTQADFQGALRKAKAEWDRSDRGQRSMIATQAGYGDAVFGKGKRTLAQFGWDEMGPGEQRAVARLFMDRAPSKDPANTQDSLGSSAVASADFERIVSQSSTLAEARKRTAMKFGKARAADMEDNLQSFWKAKVNAKNAQVGPNDSLTRAIAKLGGISTNWMQDLTGDTVPPKGHVGLFQKTGTSPDDMAAKLIEAGYIVGEDYGKVATTRPDDDMRRMLQDEIKGRRKHYQIDSERARNEAERAALDDYRQQAESAEAALESQLDQIAAEYGQEAAEQMRQYIDDMRGYTTSMDSRIDAAVESQLTEERETDNEDLRNAAAADATEDGPREKTPGSSEGAGETGRRPGKAAGESDQGFDLNTQTEESLRAEADRKAGIERDKKLQSSKADADDQRSSFTLSGSDRPADVAESRGQKPLFSQDAPIGRFRPKSRITLSKPLAGPSGAKLIAYEWAWTPEGYIDARGEERTKRVSDWDRAESSAETGRDIVHKFVVEMPSGAERVVSLESATDLMGFTAAQKGQFRSVASAAKTVAKNEMQIAVLRGQLEEVLAIKQEVDALQAPAAKRVENERLNWRMEDAAVRQIEAGPLTDERRRVLERDWRAKRFYEMSDGKYAYGKESSIRREIEDLEARVARARKKLDEAARGQDTLFSREAMNTYAEHSIDPEEVPVGTWAGRVMFHGTSDAGAASIKKDGILNEKSSSGYFGVGFYMASDAKLAADNYANFAEDDDSGGEGSVVAVQIKPQANILDLRAPAHWDEYVRIQKLPGFDLGSRYIDKFMVKNGVDGLFDRSFGGVIVYNEKMLEVLPDEGTLSSQNEDTITIDGLARATINSLGNPIASTEQGIRNFWKWFGNSKVVDAQGRPRVIYHGTDKKFSKINMRKGAQNLFWFTSDRSSIESGNVGASGNGVIMEMYAKIENPADWKQYEKLGLYEYKRENLDGAILSKGDGQFDGFILDPSQIKSVKNRGEFSPDNNSILASQDSVTDSPSFKRWFGKSKVVDSSGRPLVVYHGAPDARFMKEDGIFKNLKEKYGATEGQENKRAFWFAKSRSAAATYADDRRAWDYQNSEPGIVAAYLSLQNPLIIDAEGTHWRVAQRRGKASDVIEEARSKGHDGVIIRNVRDNYQSMDDARGKNEATDTYVVFDSKQIKSATDNVGTFDPNNPSILKSASKSWLVADTSVTGLTVDEVKAAVAGPMEVLNQQFDLDVIVVQSVKDLPPAALRHVNPNARYRGAYHDGAVYLFADNLQSARGAQVTLAHELVGHKGVLEAVTAEEWTDIKDTIDRQLKLNKAAIDIGSEVDRRYGSNGRRFRMQGEVQRGDETWYKEFLAVAAEKRVLQSKMQTVFAKIKAALRRILKALGFNQVFSDSDIEIILSNSEKFLRESGEAMMAGEETLASQDERDEYAAAVAKGLPMDQKSRMARAEAMGFDTSKVLYHGTNAQFTEFNSEFFGEGSSFSDWGEGFYFTDVREAAETYGDTVMEVFLRMENPATNEVMMSPEIQNVIDDGMGFQTVQEALEKMGYDSIIVDHVGGGREFVVFNPANVRSINAAFDPDYAESADLLASQKDQTDSMREAALGGQPLFSRDTQNKRMASQSEINMARRTILGMAAGLGAMTGSGLYSKATSKVSLGKAAPFGIEALEARLPESALAALKPAMSEIVTDGNAIIKDALNAIAKDGHPSVRAMAAKISTLIPDTGISVNVDNDSIVNMNGQVNQNRYVMIDGKLGTHGAAMQLFTAEGREGLTVATFMHESLHAAIMARYGSLAVGVINDNFRKADMSTPRAKAALAQFRSLWEEFKEVAIADEGLDVSISEAVADPDEFFVRALTDPFLQEYLAAIEYQGKTLFERFKDWIKVGLFGFEDGAKASWLDAAITASEDLLDQMIADNPDFKMATAIYRQVQARTSHNAVFKGQRSPNILFSQEDTDFQKENASIREEDKTLWNRAKREMRRQLTPGGLLPDSVFKSKIARDNKLAVVEFDAAHLIGNLERAIRKDYGVHASKLSTPDLNALSEALGGKIPSSVKGQTKAALIAMRAYIDEQSRQYVQILREQVTGMAGQLDEGERQLLDAFLGMSRIDNSTGTAAEKGAATKQRNAILNDAKAQVKELWGDGKQMQESLGRVAALAEKIGLIETITSNEGTYVHRSYQAFDDPDWPKKVPDKVLNDARTYLMDRLMADGDMTEAQGRQRARVLIEDILKEGTAYDNLEAFIKESKLGAKDLSVLKSRKRIAPQIRALLGEHMDPRLNFAKSVTKMGRLIWNQRFLDRVREVGMGTFLFTEESRPPNTTKIAAEGSEIYSPLNGLYAEREVVQAFKDALGKEQMANWYKAVVQINGVVKFGKTVLSPTTAARNWQSAMFFTVANGHFDWSQMGKSLSGLREYFLHAGDGEKLNYLRKLKDLGVVYDTPYAGEMMRLLDDSEIENMVAGSDTAMGIRKALHLAQKFYQYGDDFWKIIGFENEKNMLMKYGGMSKEKAEIEAAERIRNTYPTYSMVGRGVQSLRRFPLVGTFVSFPAEIIRTSFNMLKYLQQDWKNPKLRPMAKRRAAGLMIAAGFAAALQEMSKLMFDIDDDDEEAIRLQAAPWQQNSNLVFAGRDGDGKIRYFDISFLDPYGYWKRPINAIMRDQPWQDEAVSAAGELLKPFFGTDILAGAIFQVAANKKDTGGEVYKETDTVDRQLVDIANHLRKSLQPGIASNLERTWKALEGETSASGQKYNLHDEALGWVGWRVTTLDPKVALYYRSFDFNDAKSDASRTLTQVLTSPNDVDDDEITDAYELAVKMRAQAYGDMAKMVSASRRSGMNNEQIATTLRGANVSRADITALLYGSVPRWAPTVQSERAAVRRAEAILGPEQAREIQRRYQTARREAIE